MVISQLEERLGVQSGSLDKSKVKNIIKSLSSPTQKEEEPKKLEQEKKKKRKLEDDNNEEPWVLELGNLTRVSINQFKSFTLVDIRKYYLDKSTGEQKPTQKGISLKLTEWENLKKNFELIDKELELKKKGK